MTKQVVRLGPTSVSVSISSISYGRIVTRGEITSSIGIATVVKAAREKFARHLSARREQIRAKNRARRLYGDDAPLSWPGVW